MLGRLLLLAALAAWPTTAGAGYYRTGNDLHDACQGESTIYCLGYVTGIVDGFWMWGGLSNVCIPTEVTAGQLRDIAVKYLEDHPEQRHVPAVILVNDALSAHWPC